MLSKLTTKQLTFTAACIALALVLSQVRLYRMPQGGSVTAFSMFFIVLAAYWFGAPLGIIAGAVLGMLRLMLGAYVVHPIQFLLDYPMAYAALGLAGYFRKYSYGLSIGYVVGVAGRFLVAVIAGVIFFSSYTELGTLNVLWPSITYSLTYNISYIWPEALATLVVINIPAVSKGIKQVGAPLGLSIGDGSVLKEAKVGFTFRIWAVICLAFGLGGGLYSLIRVLNYPHAFRGFTCRNCEPINIIGLTTDECSILTVLIFVSIITVYLGLLGIFRKKN
jgi:thiamine transporter